MKKIFTHLIISLALLLNLGSFNPMIYSVEAASFTPSIIPKPANLPGPTIDKQSETGTRRILTENVIPNFIIGSISFFAAVSLLFLMVGAVRFMTIYGNEEAIEKARNQIIYSLAGLLLALLAYTIVTIIINLKYDEIKVERPENLNQQTQSAP